MPASSTTSLYDQPPLKPVTAAGARIGAAYRVDRDGWQFVHIEGSPADRGWQHGWLLASEIRAAISSIKQLIWLDSATEFGWWAENANAMWLDKLKSDSGGSLGGFGVEILDELQGIVDGANARFDELAPWLTLQDLLGWNGYPELVCQWFPNVCNHSITPPIPLPLPGTTCDERRQPSHASVRNANRFVPHHCSAFVATGEYTKDGGVVGAHTTWQRFANGDFYNIILEIGIPEGAGHSILMQTAPGYVASTMDFGQNAAGMIAISTSINGVNFLPEELPYFLRARRAGQHASTIEEWISLFREGNNGGYSNNWLLAEAATGRITSYDLTANNESCAPIVSSGYYASYNLPQSHEIQVREIGSPSPQNIANGSVSRRLRFDQLMSEHKGAIDANRAQQVIADHYDVYERALDPNSRTICGHSDNVNGAAGSNQSPYDPFGSLDGKVTTKSSAREGSFRARWGRACGTAFNAKTFFEQNPQFDTLKHLTADRPPQPWTGMPPRNENSLE